MLVSSSDVAGSVYVILCAGAASKPLFHSMPDVAFRLFKNTFGAYEPSLASAFRFVSFGNLTIALFDILARFISSKTCKLFKILTNFTSNT